MAKIHIDRLQKKYEGVKVSGNNYAELVKQILDTNIGNVERSMSRKAAKKWNEFSEKRFRTDREIRLVLPASEEVIPPRALQILKAAEKGELIRDTLRDKLTKDLRETLFAFDDQKYITGRGALAGRINPRLVAEYEKKIRGTFQNYTKKDPKFGVPKNVKTIATTEVRSAVNNVKNTYTNRMIESNPNLIVKKTWIQNRSKSKEPRQGHNQINGVTIDYNDFFKVPLLVKRKGRYVLQEVSLMRHPHDPAVDRAQNINCHCDFDIKVLKKKKGE